MMKLGFTTANSRSNKICCHFMGALMQQLIKSMLAVNPGLTPNNRTGFIIHCFAVPIYRLAIAFHFGLLQIGRQTMQILIIRQHSQGVYL